MGQELNFGSREDFCVESVIWGREQNLGSGAKFWVGSKILGQEQNFVLEAKFHVEVANFVLGETFWVWGENILEIGQFNAKKIYRIGVVGGVGGGQVNNSGTLLSSQFQSATNYYTRNQYCFNPKTRILVF